jgi:hypothetical protein
MIRRIVYYVTLLSFAFLSYGTESSRKQTVISVSSNPDPTGLFSTSRLYLGELRTQTPVIIEAIQMPGGYVGSGTFFHCSVEKWDARRGQWRVLVKHDLDQFYNPDIKKIEIKPSLAREVCRALLPHDGGAWGDRVRFRLGYTWHDFGQSVLSPPFVIEKKTSP